MILLTLIAIFVISKLDLTDAGAEKIVSAARSQIGVPYVFGGGNCYGPTKGGFDCSGLAEYAVYQGTNICMSRTAGSQYIDSRCRHIPYASHLPGDLVFFGTGSDVEHVGIISGPNTLIHAPKPGDHVKEALIWSKGRMPYVQRCWVNAYMPSDSSFNLSIIMANPILKLLILFIKNILRYSLTYN